MVCDGVALGLDSGRNLGVAGSAMPLAPLHLRVRRGRSLMREPYHGRRLDAVQQPLGWQDLGALVGLLRQQSPINLCLRMQVWYHACANNARSSSRNTGGSKPSLSLGLGMKGLECGGLAESEETRR